MNPLDAGRMLYLKEKDYDGALKQFNEAVRVTTGSMRVNALDYRAATYEKLGDLQHALRDARNMIDLQPDLAKGYLRCAKVLLLKGKDDVALQIYELGLKKVKIGGDPDRKVIQGLYQKLQRKMKPPKNLDPLVMLPTEIAEMVCQYLNTRDRTICLAVSKPWKRFLESSTDLWMDLEIRAPKRAVTLQALKAYLRRSNYRLKSASIIISSRGLDEKKLAFLTRTCSNLAHLTIAGNAFDITQVWAPTMSLVALRTISIEVQLRWVQILHVLRHYPQLESASFSKVPKENHSIHMEPIGDWPSLPSMRHLHIRKPRTAEDVLEPIDYLEKLQQAMPNLRSLTLKAHGLLMDNHNFSGWKSLEYLDLSDCRIRAMPTLPVSLKHLDLADAWIMCLNLQAVLDQIPLLSLRHLDVTGFDLHVVGDPHEDISSRVIAELAGSSSRESSLVHFAVGQRPQQNNVPSAADIHANSSYYQKCSSLEELRIDSLIYTDAQLAAIASRYPNLRRLDCSNNTKMTGVAIKEFVEICPDLECINIMGCSSISQDALVYASKMGVRVLGFTSGLAPSASSYLHKVQIW